MPRTTTESSRQASISPQTRAAQRAYVDGVIARNQNFFSDIDIDLIRLYFHDPADGAPTMGNATQLLLDTAMTTKRRQEVITNALAVLKRAIDWDKILNRWNKEPPQIKIASTHIQKATDQHTPSELPQKPPTAEENKYPHSCKSSDLPKQGKTYIQWVTDNKAPLVILDRKGNAQGVLVSWPLAQALTRHIWDFEWKKFSVSNLLARSKTIHAVIQGQEATAVVICKTRTPVVAVFPPEWLDRAVVMAKDVPAPRANMAPLRKEFRKVCPMRDIQKYGQSCISWVIENQEPVVIVDRYKTPQGILIPLSLAEKFMRESPDLRREDRTLSSLYRDYATLRQQTEGWVDTITIMNRYTTPALAYLPATWTEKVLAAMMPK